MKWILVLLLLAGCTTARLVDREDVVLRVQDLKQQYQAHKLSREDYASLLIDEMEMLRAEQLSDKVLRAYGDNIPNYDYLAAVWEIQSALDELYSEVLDEHEHSIFE